MKKKYVVTLTAEERRTLRHMIAVGQGSARKLMHARILLKAERRKRYPDWEDTRIADALDVAVSTVERVRKLLVEEGLDAALERRPPRREYHRKLGGKEEAHLIALACSSPPDGHAQWTLRLLADRMVRLEYVDSVSHETVRRVLKKNELKPWLKQEWCIPPEQNGEFVYHLEDVLEVYTRPDDARRPLVCMDETPKQLVGETRCPVPTAPGHAARHDYEYVRNGVANVFMFFEPLAGRRRVKVTEQRTRIEWAEAVRELVDRVHPKADKITLVMDQLNTHHPGSLYEAFPPDEAKRIADRLEIHYTPKHGSWLNMAEIELAVLTRQCLDQRIGNIQRLRREANAWTTERNTKKVKVRWRFTTPDARIKLHRLYPSLDG